MSNQGGSRVVASRMIPLDEPGTYISENAHHVAGEWKTSVGLQRGNEVMSAPVYLPADPEIGASEVPALPERTVEFGVVTEIMLREAHEGPVWPSVVAYTEVVTMLAIWIFLFALADRKIKEDRVRSMGEPKPSQPTQPVG